MSIPDDFGMRLPEAFTCSDCKFFDYCHKLFGCKQSSAVCDWAPSRFQLSETKHVEAKP